MRKLNTADAFKMARILKYTNLKNTILTAYRENKGLNQEELGVEVIFSIIDACGDAKVEADFYELLGGITEKKPEEIREQNLAETMDDVKAVFKENNMAGFFGSVLSLELKS